MSLRGGLRLAIFGLFLGVAGSLALNRVIGSLLYGVSSWDPFVLIMTALALAGAVVLAAYIPARRGAGLHPATVLKGE